MMPQNALVNPETRADSERQAPTANGEWLETPRVRAECEHLALLDWEESKPQTKLSHPVALFSTVALLRRWGHRLYDAAVILLMIASLAATVACFLRIK